MRKILSTLIVDEKRGLTALDALSTTYKKAAEIAAKSSKAALSLILVVAAFLGFNTLTGREGVVTPEGSAITLPSDKSFERFGNLINWAPAVTRDPRFEEKPTGVPEASSPAQL